MKKFLLAVIAMFLFSVVYSFAQTNLDVISLKNGKTYKGRIVTDVPPDYLEIQLNNGEIIKVLYQDIKKREYEVQPDKNTNSSENVKIKDDSYSKTGSIGLGYGIPYGLIGINGEYMFAQTFSATVGFGFALYGWGGCAGGRIYLAPRRSNFRPMLNIYYGTNLLVPDEKLLSSGFNVGAGFKWMFDKKLNNGLEIEFIYLITSKLLNRGYWIADGERRRISLGYRIGF